MKTPACLPHLILAIALAWSTQPALAQVSQSDAAALAQQASGARVLSVDRAERAGRSAWRVKLVSPQGDVRVVWIDAASGRTLP